MKVNEMQKFSTYIDHMCHAIGFEPEKTRKNQRVHEYYRNYFCAGEKDKETWEELAQMEYAEKESNHIVDKYYYVTQKGLDFLSTIYKIGFKSMR